MAEERPTGAVTHEGVVDRIMVARCIIYSRVSTDAQERDGTSLVTQELACRDYARSNGWTVVEEVRDAASGFTLERPGMVRVREVLRQGCADVVLSYAVDRLARNQNHMVGHSLNRGRYLYYRCRHSYGSEWKPRCYSKYIKCADIEGAVRQALADLLAHPERILAEVQRFRAFQTSESQLPSILEALQDIEARQRRLVRLFTDGDLPVELMEEQRRELSQRRAQLEDERRSAEARTSSPLDLKEIERSLPRAVAFISEWVSESAGDRFDLLLRSVDARIHASDSEVRIEGSVPVYELAGSQHLVTIERTSA